MKKAIVLILTTLLLVCIVACKDDPKPITGIKFDLKTAIDEYNYSLPETATPTSLAQSSVKFGFGGYSADVESRTISSVEAASGPVTVQLPTGHFVGVVSVTSVFEDESTRVLKYQVTDADKTFFTVEEEKVLEKKLTLF